MSTEIENTLKNIRKLELPKCHSKLGWDITSKLKINK